QYFVDRFGLLPATAASKWSLTLFHAAWFAVNLTALAHFISSSLLFLEPGARERMRIRFTANKVIPGQQRGDLRFALYMNMAQHLGADIPSDALVFGLDFREGTSPELATTFERPHSLYDVRRWPLRLAIRHWWRRCIAADPSLSSSASQRGGGLSEVQLVFV